MHYSMTKIIVLAAVCVNVVAAGVSLAGTNITSTLTTDGPPGDQKAIQTFYHGTNSVLTIITISDKSGVETSYCVRPGQYSVFFDERNGQVSSIRIAFGPEFHELEVLERNSSGLFEGIPQSKLDERNKLEDIFRKHMETFGQLRTQKEEPREAER